ncbi:hypothetical protein EMIT07CA2_550151 [Brevibacillus sp. IT-7CA2]
MLKAEARREKDLTEDYKGLMLFSNLIGCVIGPILAYTATIVHTSTHWLVPDAGSLLMTLAFSFSLIHFIISGSTLFVHKQILETSR